MTMADTQFNSYELDPLAAFGVGFDELPILISDGMGVESATIIAKLADDPGLLPGFSWRAPEHGRRTASSSSTIRGSLTRSTSRGRTRWSRSCARRASCRRSVA